MSSQKMFKKYEAKRDAMFPELKKSATYWSFNGEEGWRNVPRTMVHAMIAMDSLCTGEPPSKVYFALWMRCYETFYISEVNLETLAFESGLNGQRAVSTLKKKLLLLKELGFIHERGDFQHIVVVDPFPVLKSLFEKGRLTDQKLLDSLVARSLDITQELGFDTTVIQKSAEKARKSKEPAAVQ